MSDFEEARVKGVVWIAQRNGKLAVISTSTYGV